MSDLGFRSWFQKYGAKWDPVDAKGESGGYKLYRAYQLGLKPDAAGHLPDFAPNGEHLKGWSDPNYITNGVDNSTGYQVAPPSYTGPMTAAIARNASRYFHAKTAVRHGGPGGWDDIPKGHIAPTRIPPAGYMVPVE